MILYIIHACDCGMTVARDPGSIVRCWGCGREFGTRVSSKEPKRMASRSDRAVLAQRQADNADIVRRIKAGINSPTFKRS